MSELSTKNRGQLVIDLMFRALRVKDAELNSLAAQLGEQLGGEPVHRMILEAARRKNPLPYRLRLLAVIERVGSVPTTDDCLLLHTLAADKNPQIRQAAARCVIRCPAAGP